MTTPTLLRRSIWRALAGALRIITALDEPWQVPKLATAKKHHRHVWDMLLVATGCFEESSRVKCRCADSTTSTHCSGAETSHSTPSGGIESTTSLCWAPIPATRAVPAPPLSYRSAEGYQRIPAPPKKIGELSFAACMPQGCTLRYLDTRVPGDDQWDDSLPSSSLLLALTSGMCVGWHSIACVHVHRMNRAFCRRQRVRSVICPLVGLCATSLQFGKGNRSFACHWQVDALMFVFVLKERL
eukprot:2748572-Amphidinium_carterae.1